MVAKWEVTRLQLVPEEKTKNSSSPWENMTRFGNRRMNSKKYSESKENSQSQSSFARSKNSQTLTILKVLPTVISIKATKQLFWIQIRQLDLSSSLEELGEEKQTKTASKLMRITLALSRSKAGTIEMLNKAEIPPLLKPVWWNRHREGWRHRLNRLQSWVYRKMILRAVPKIIKLLNYQRFDINYIYLQC